MAGVYIHIPFCQYICYYCNFNKVFIEGQPVDEYLQMLMREIDLVLPQYQNETIDTIYIGGGTPSALSVKQIDYLLAGINERFTISADCEFTFEANPNDFVTLDKLKALRAGGVTRLSIGVQSFNDRLLKKIGRTHSAKDVYTSIANARKVGFENISIDLIYRLPGQTFEDFKDTLSQALSLNLPHYATYSLILENKTVFYNMQRQGKLHLPSQDVEADEYQLVIDELGKHDILQYEISNFSKRGMESKHNLLYWHNEHYFGFGAGAYGYLGKDRYHNFGPIQQYMAPLKEHKVPVLMHHLVPMSEQIEEELFLGLRTKKGVSISNFQNKYHMSLQQLYGKTIDDLISEKLAVIDGDNLHLTEHGEFIGNDVFEKFLLDENQF